MAFDWLRGFLVGLCEFPGVPGVLMRVLHGGRVWLVFRISSVLDFDRFEFGWVP